MADIENTIDFKSILTGLLSKAYKLDNGKIEELFNTEGATAESIDAQLTAIDTQRVSQLKGMNADNTDSFNQGYAKAKKDERVKFENEIKAEFGITSETIGLDLIKQIVAEQKPADAAGGLTEDAVKRHPSFLQMERDLKKQLNDEKTTWESKLNEIETASKRNEVFQNVKTKAVDILTGLNPIQSENAKVATTHRNLFIEALKGYDYDLQADGSLLPVKEGKRIQDAHGHAVTFEDMVKGMASEYYDFAQNNGGSNAGNRNKDEAAGAAAGKTFKDEAEFNAFVQDKNIPLPERLAAAAVFNGTATEPEK